MQKKFYGLKRVGAAHKNQKRLEIIVLRAGQPLEPAELLLHAIEGLYVLRVIPEPIHLNPEPSIRSYYMTTEEI